MRHGSVQFPGTFEGTPNERWRQEAARNNKHALAVFIAVIGAGKGTRFAPSFVISGAHARDEHTVPPIGTISGAPWAVKPIFNKIELNAVDSHGICLSFYALQQSSTAHKPVPFSLFQ